MRVGRGEEMNGHKLMKKKHEGKLIHKRKDNIKMGFKIINCELQLTGLMSGPMKAFNIGDVRRMCHISS